MERELIPPSSYPLAYGPFSYWHKHRTESAQKLTHGNRELAAIIGWDGVQIFDSGIDLTELCYHYATAMEEYSCNQCIPCRVGSRRLVELFEKARKGKAVEKDLKEAEELCRTISITSLCDIGKTTPKALSYLLTEYRHFFLKKTRRVRTKNSYEYRSVKTAPCMQACPIHLDIPRYIEEIKKGNFPASLQTIRERLPLPGLLGRVCVRPCEFNCRRGRVDQPLQIKHLKRFVADAATAGQTPAWPRKGKKKGIKTAIVGSGPAGLTCAKYLAERGYDVTIFEMLTEPGGMAAVGIPDYRLPRVVLRREIAAIEKLGVKIIYERALGAHFSLDDLQAEGFRSVFIGMGCHCHKSMGVEGEDKGYYGFVPGVYFLRNINLGLFDEIPKGKKIIVIGGGNVAIDCCRTAFRVGFEESHVVYRRSKKEMPADAVEVNDAEAEGVCYHFLTAPKRILGAGGKVIGLECLRMELGEPDATGRRRPVEVPGSEFTIDADVIVAAIGQEGDFSCMCNLPGVEVTPKGAIVINENFMTTREGVFSGGDCVTGPDVVIRACAHGRLSALKIDRFLQSGRMEQLDEEADERLLAKLQVFDPREKIPLPAGPGRVAIQHESPEERKKDFREVEKGYTADEAIREAERCLRCYRVLLYAYKC
jgi:formate dehydrogenase beta subunit